MPENVAHYLASMPVTSVPAHKTPEARMITCMLPTRNKRRWNVGVDPFMFASLFTKVALSEKTNDAGCDGSERHKQNKAIREEYNQKYRPMPAVTKDLPYQLAVGCDSMTMASLTKLFRDLINYIVNRTCLDS